MSKSCDNSTDSSKNHLQTNGLPPTIILSKKDIPVKWYNPKLFDNCGLYEEIKNFTWESLMVPPHDTNLERNKSNVTSLIQTDSANDENQVNGEVKSMDSCVQQEVCSQSQDISAHGNLELTTQNIPSNSFDTSLENTELTKSTTAIPKQMTQTTSKTESKTKKNLRDRFYEKVQERTKCNSDHTQNELINEKVCDLKESSRIEKQCECENCDNFLSCKTWCHSNLSFGETNGTKTNWPLLTNNIQEKHPVIIKEIDTNLVLHGPFIPNQISSINETFFDESIKNYVKSLHGTTIKDVQRYIWPAMQRGLNAFMVGPPKSGKTWSYLPAFCSFSTEKNDRYVELGQYEGPLIIILCPNNEVCYDLEKATRSLVAKCSEEVVIGILTDKSSVLNNCDILITQPVVLEKCLKSGTIKLKRLCHLAIENAHIVLRSHHQRVGKLFRILNNVQTNRPHNKTIQIIATSEKWSMDLDTLLKKLHSVPIVCFNDYLEHALYARVQFKKKKINTSFKLYSLVDALKQKFSTHKSVIFCNDDIGKVKSHLEQSGVECIEISPNLSDDEIIENMEMWDALRGGYYRVLICSDSSFNKTEKVFNAEWVFHYSVPSDWTQFQKRFKCLSENLRSPIELGDQSCVSPQCSVIMMDELSSDQLFLNFFEDLTRNSAKYLQL